MINIQAFVDNLVSNAVRYTDPARGIDLTVDMDRTEVSIRFCITVADYCRGIVVKKLVDQVKLTMGADRGATRCGF